MTPCYKRGKGVQGGSYNNEDIFSFLCRQAVVTEGGKVLLLGREGGTSRQTELRLTSVAAFYKTRLLAADDDGNVDFVVDHVAS